MARIEEHISESTDFMQRAQRLGMTFDSVSRTGKLFPGVVNGVKEAGELMKQFDDILNIQSAVNSEPLIKPTSNNYLREYGTKFGIDQKRETEILANKF